MMKKILIHLVAGARPNFVKIAPLYASLSTRGWADVRIIHTNQHFSKEMSEQFFTDFSLPEPHHRLQSSTSSEDEQLRSIISSYTQLCTQERPDLIIVVGDVTSTLAAAMVAKELKIKLGHVEAGLRSYDERMPEEKNRRLTDHMSDFLWTPSEDASQNLDKEGIPKERIHLVGNIMIDAYKMVKDKIDAYPSSHRKDPYAIVTIHRQENVDYKDRLAIIIDKINLLSKKINIILPIHHRLKNNAEAFNLISNFDRDRIDIIQPLSYIPFMSLVKDSKFILTDSGGISEETSYLHIPCFTLRENTERPITIKMGTNKLITMEDIEKLDAMANISESEKKTIPFWDGMTAERITKTIESNLG